MSKGNIPAFLYSNKNLDLAYKLRNFCMENNVTVFNVIDLREYFAKRRDLLFSVLFIDTFTYSVSRDVISLISDDQGNSTVVVFLCGGMGSYDDMVDNEKIFKINCDNFHAQMGELMQKINVKHLECSKLSSPKCMPTTVYDYLISFKLSPKHLGFSYLKDAILYCLAGNGAVGNLQADIYPSLSAKYNTTTYSIERSIRLAIDYAWKNKDENLLDFSSKPSNKEFIAIAVNKLYYET